MGADDDAVAGLQTDQGLEDSGGSGVGGGDHSGYHTDGLGDLLDAEGGVFLQNAAGFFVFIGMIDILSCIVILNDLVFHNAHAGFGNRQTGQGDSSLVGCGCGSQEDLIHLLLGKGCILRLGFAAAIYGNIQLLGGGSQRVGFFHKDHLSFR